VGDVDDMASKALQILRDDQTLEKFKQNAYNVASKFDIINILPLYEEIYEKAYNSRFKNTV
jgi:glycosyltransferase involved in cell wall biosynthesis